jgi:hypothetical protein
MLKYLMKPCHFILGKKEANYVFRKMNNLIKKSFMILPIFQENNF